jgi:predicted nucleic-acid-binding Zn-ribbon protein
MTCKSCGSENPVEFAAEMNLHFLRPKSAVKASVLLFPRLMICLNCGFSEFKVSESELHLLDKSSGKN